jgi:hypothetical protein
MAYDGSLFQTEVGSHGRFETAERWSEAIERNEAYESFSAACY